MLKSTPSFIKVILTLWFVIAALPVAAEAPSSSDLTPYIRYSKNPGLLETSVITYKNPRGQTVDLISAVHIGSTAYYQALNQRFQTYDAVLYELVLPDEMAGQRLPSQMSSNSGVSGMQGMMARSLGLTTQLEKIDYSRPNFVHADLTSSGLSQKMAERQENMMTYLMQAISSSGSIDESQLGLTEQELAQIDFMALLNGQASAKDRKLLRKMFAATLANSGGLMSGFGNSALLGERNKQALSVLDQQTQKGRRRMAIFYGAAHMPDLASRMEKSGWRRVRSDWVKAWSI